MTQLFWIRLGRKLTVGLEFLSHSFILLPYTPPLAPVFLESPPPWKIPSQGV